MVLLRYSNITIDQVTDAAVVFQGLFAHKDRIDQDKEHFYVMHVNTRQQINLVELVAISTLNHAEVHPRETFRRAIVAGSYSIIVAHNHLSGDVTPSEADIRLIQTLIKAGELLLIPLLDHIIFTAMDETFFSFKDNKTHVRVRSQTGNHGENTKEVRNR